MPEDKSKLEVENETGNDDVKQTLVVHRIYTKALGLETIPMTLDLPNDPKKNNIEVQLNVSSDPRDKDLYEAILTLNLTGKHDTNLLWRIQSQEAGLFTIKGFAKEQLENILNVFCMHTIYPYACSKIAQTISNAGFQSIHLVPMNFEMLYQEHLKKAKDVK